MADSHIHVYMWHDCPAVCVRWSVCVCVRWSVCEWSVCEWSVGVQCVCVCVGVCVRWSVQCVCTINKYFS